MEQRHHLLRFRKRGGGGTGSQTITYFVGWCWSCLSIVVLTTSLIVIPCGLNLFLVWKFSLFKTSLISTVFSLFMNLKQRKNKPDPNLNHTKNSLFFKMYSFLQSQCLRWFSFLSGHFVILSP